MDRAPIPAALVVVLTIGACVDDPAGPPRDGAAGSRPVGIGYERSYTFDPSRASRACSRDDDCVILSAIATCTMCCRETAVARGDAETARAEVVAACTGRGGLGLSSCLMACAPARAACSEGMCVLATPDGGGPEPPPFPAPQDAGATD